MPTPEEIKNIDNLSGKEKVELARKALKEYIHLLSKLKDEQRELLISVLNRLDQEQIAELKKHLAEL